MAATTRGWLMVWPKAIGSAVLSQARSANGADTKRSRSTAPTAPSTLSSEMPDCLSSAIRRCMAGTFIARSLAQAVSNWAASLRRVASCVRSRCSGVTEMKPPRTAARSLSSSNSCSPGV